MFWQRIKNLIKLKLQSFREDSGRDFSADYEKWKEYRRAQSSPQHSPEAGYFRLLEMDPTDNLDAIKSQYRRLIRKYHPDKHDADDEKREAARKLSIALNEAWEYFEKKLSA